MLLLQNVALSMLLFAITVSEAMVSRCYFSTGAPGDNPFQECRPNSNTPSCFTFTCSGSGGSNSQVLKGCNDVDDSNNAFQCRNLKASCQANNGVPDCQTCDTDMCNGNNDPTPTTSSCDRPDISNDYCSRCCVATKKV